jgi:hypothetical protein
MRAGAFVVELIHALPSVESIRLLSYSVSPGLEARLSEKPETIDFETRLAEALVHDATGRIAYDVGSSELTLEYIEALAASLPPNVALAVTSHVTLRDRTIGHIPMMDLKCETSPSLEKSLVALFKAIGSEHAAMLNSGNSYHYYGFDILGESGWRAFLGRCLLLEPLVDMRYIAHRLIDGFCSLRINRTVTKATIPTVIEWW